uniref:Uncharacterized protein n=1 Tax=Octopus bimaculoides TaxID=37653 RepID=A0A0L8I5Q4_OCTBM
MVTHSLNLIQLAVTSIFKKLHNYYRHFISSDGQMYGTMFSIISLWREGTSYNS